MKETSHLMTWCLENSLMAEDHEWKNRYAWIQAQGSMEIGFECSLQMSLCNL